MSVFKSIQPRHTNLQPRQRGAKFASLLSFCLIFTLQFTVGCSQSPKDTPRLSEQQYFDNAQKALLKNNFLLAVQHLEELESRFPFGRYHEQAQLDLIYAYYQSLDYTTAALQAQSFMQQYPDHPEVDYAYYMQGLANYSIDRGFLARILPTQAYERDIASIKRAYSDFGQLVYKFPQSRYAADARQRMLYLRNLLAQHELQAAQFYFKRGAYLAALQRCHTLLKQFPHSPSVTDALALSVKIYTKIDLPQLAEAAAAAQAKHAITLEQHKAANSR